MSVSDQIRAALGALPEGETLSTGDLLEQCDEATDSSSLAGILKACLDRGELLREGTPGTYRYRLNPDFVPSAPGKPRRTPLTAAEPAAKRKPKPAKKAARKVAPATRPPRAARKAAPTKAVRAKRTKPAKSVRRSSTRRAAPAALPAVVVQAIGANAVQVGGSHYQALEPQPWDVIAAWNLDFMRGNVVKYVARAPLKGGIEDLRKAQHYLAKAIEVAEAEAA